ncbi:unnamed protein product [Parascedosporium putredinis]|uniref:Uncharacterized protein n=1 Tax=Parascedosporium putredinis TaxID=1442378 RepID=A0A9P1H2F8_9PEZI|nr:unnamed protein product [Parascedosporium putredinis]CAI7993634.1 unnamed protein product [Parascedosporium putredinis]
MDRSNLPPDEHLPEVVPDQSPQALPKEAAPQYEAHLGEKDPKYPVLPEDVPKQAIDPYGSPETVGAVPVSPHGTPASPIKEEKRILGLKRKTFIIFIVALVVLAAALGGGLGGGLAKKSKGSNTAGQDGEESQDEPTPTESETTSSSSTTTSATPTATFLNNGTARTSGFAFQAYSELNYGGDATDIYIDEGFFDFGFEAWSYVWLPGDRNCCITFCEDKKNGTGYFCQERFRKEASDSFPRLAIYCGDNIRKIMPCS